MSHAHPLSSSGGSGAMRILQGVAPVQDVYNRLLSSAYRWYYRIIDPDWALEQDMDTWRKIHRDPLIVQAKAQRQAMVAGREWRIEAKKQKPTEKDKQAADVVADAFIERLTDFCEARALMANAIFQGRSWMHIAGGRYLASLGGGPVMKWWLPTRLEHVDKNRFQFVTDVVKIDGIDRARTRLQMFDLDKLDYITLDPERIRDFVRIVHMDEESTLGYGRGLLTSLYFTWWWKQELLKEGLNGVERWAQGLIAIEVDWDAQPGKVGNNAEAVRQKYLDDLEAMRARHQIVVSKGDKIIPVSSSREAGVVESLIKYADDRMLGLILGSIRPFGGGQDGSSMGHGQARVEEDQTEMLLALDRQKIEEGITEGVVSQFWRLNQPQLRVQGLAGASMPRFRIQVERQEDPQVNSAVIETLLRSGVPLKREEVYEKTGFSVPEEGDDIIEGQPALEQGFDFANAGGIGEGFGGGNGRFQ